MPGDDVLPAKDVGTHVALTGHPSTSSAEDQMDGAVAGAINSLLCGDVGEQTIPQSLPLHTTELQADLSDHILSKFWAKEYVDFFELINKVPPQQMTVSTGYSHQIISVMPQSKGRHICTIDQWTFSFLLFGAVYTERFPEVAPGMFKYCSDNIVDIHVCPVIRSQTSWYARSGPAFCNQEAISRSSETVG